METYIAMLRGINVSGQKKVEMAKLKKMCEALKFKNVQTYIQSGNVVFKSPAADALKIARIIEEKIKKTFGFEVPVVLRTKDALQSAVKKNPFSKREPERLYVTFLSAASEKVPMEEINRAKDPSEEFAISGKEIYFHCPKGYGNTKLSNNFFENKLKLTATTRNWRTVNTLLEMALS